MSAEKRDGEYLELWWEPDDPPWEVVRGHVSAESFMEVVKAQTGITGETTVAHTYARFVPVAEFHPYDSRLVLCKEPGRGAFAVTIGYEWN